MLQNKALSKQRATNVRRNWRSTSNASHQVGWDEPTANGFPLDGQLKNLRTHKKICQIFYLFGRWTKAPSLPLLSPVWGCFSMWTGESTFKKWGWKRASLKSVNMRALELPPSMHTQAFPPKHRVRIQFRGFYSVCTCACVRCLRLLWSAAECRPKHKSRSLLRPSYRHASDYRTILVLPPPPPFQWQNMATETGGQRHVSVHVQVQIWLVQGNKGEGAWRFCNHSV